MRKSNDFDSNSIKFCLFILSLCASYGCQAYGQAAEMVGANSVATVGLTQPNSKSILAAVHPNLSPNSTVVSASPSPAVNRRNLEQRAGRNGGKLLLRSVPSGGQTWIDGVFVGRTPLLLILAPGKYHLEIHGPRQKFASGVVELQPSEIRDVAMTLMVRYPTNVVVR